MTLLFIFVNLIKFLNIILTVLLMVAFYTVKERKIISFIQRRKGPALVGFAGLLQAVADGLKLLIKEGSEPTNADRALYIFCPIFAFFLSLLAWSVIPLGFNFQYVEMRFNILFLLAVSSLNVYTIILSGWSSNSRYALLGALRAAAQMISYEISFSVILLSVIICTGSLNIYNIVAAQSYCWFCIQHLPVFLMFLFTIVAETNRLPFDFAEAESELVSGFNVEYSGMSFALFFLSEYSNMILMSTLASLLFLGGWGIPYITHLLPYSLLPVVLGIKTLIIMSFFVSIRATLPRYKYDLLMSLGWKTFLPLSLSWFIMTTFILLDFQELPAWGGFNPRFCYFDASLISVSDYQKINDMSTEVQAPNYIFSNFWLDNFEQLYHSSVQYLPFDPYKVSNFDSYSFYKKVLVTKQDFYKHLINDLKNTPYILDFGLHNLINPVYIQENTNIFLDNPNPKSTLFIYRQIFQLGEAHVYFANSLFGLTDSTLYFTPILEKMPTNNVHFTGPVKDAVDSQLLYIDLRNFK